MMFFSKTTVFFMTLWLVSFGIGSMATASEVKPSFKYRYSHDPSQSSGKCLSHGTLEVVYSEDDKTFVMGAPDFQIIYADYSFPYVNEGEKEIEITNPTQQSDKVTVKNTLGKNNNGTGYFFKNTTKNQQNEIIRILDMNLGPQKMTFKETVKSDSVTEEVTCHYERKAAYRMFCDHPNGVDSLEVGAFTFMGGNFYVMSLFDNDSWFKFDLSQINNNILVYTESENLYTIELSLEEKAAMPNVYLEISNKAMTKLNCKIDPHREFMSPYL